MQETPAKPSREERLAAKLRENLRRRKAQARMTGSDSRNTPDGAASAESNAGLSKEPPKS